MHRKNQAEPILQRRQRHVLPIHSNPAGSCIDACPAQVQYRFLLRQCPAHPRQQLPQTKRLGHIIGGALIERAHNARLIVHDGEKNHSHPLCQRLFPYGKAIAVRQLHVDNRQIDGRLCQRLLRRLHRCRMPHLVAFLLKRKDQPRCDHSIVLYQ